MMKFAPPRAQVHACCSVTDTVESAALAGICEALHVVRLLSHALCWLVSCVSGIFRPMPENESALPWLWCSASRLVLLLSRFALLLLCAAGLSLRWFVVFGGILSASFQILRNWVRIVLGGSRMCLSHCVCIYIYVCMYACISQYCGWRLQDAFVTLCVCVCVCMYECMYVRM
jgi:hypothetical protein